MHHHRTGLTSALLAAALAALAGGCSKTQTHAISGRVTGLRGAGLTLSNGLGPDLQVSEDGPVTFEGRWAEGTPFTVTVGAQPTAPRQTCAVASSHAAVGAADVLFAVACTTDAFVVGGTVTGLAGGGLVLQLAGVEDLPVAADGAFAFAAPVPSGAAYEVRVKAQPSGPAQTCLVEGGAGTVGAGPVSAVVVSCATDAFPVGGAVTGLAGGGLVLRGTPGGAAAVNGNGGFALPEAVASGTAYEVEVEAQPTGPAQTCAVERGRGTVGGAPVRDVLVRCATNAYAVGGTVAGLAGDGLRLRLNGGDELAVAASGAFRFPVPVAAGQGYEVTISGQPTAPAQRCAVAGAAGTVVAADVTSVAVSCETQAFPVGGDVTGLEGTGLVLRQSGGDPLAISARGGFAFAAPVASGARYDVAVASQPTHPWQTCAVAAGAGVVGSAPVEDVRVTCATDAFAVGGAVSGLAGAGLVLANGADEVAVAADGPFALPAVRSGASYAVAVRTQPRGPSQTCAVAAGTGVVGGAPVTGVGVTCATDAFRVGGTATGMPPAGIVVRNDGGDDLTLDFDGPFAFATPVASGAPYLVTVVADPPTLACAVDGGAGLVGDGPVTGVVVRCGCAPGRADCDGNPGNGCEVDTTSDAGNCGACGVACDAGLACVASGCGDR